LPNKQNIVCIESVLTASQCLVQVIGELQRNAARAGFAVYVLADTVRLSGSQTAIARLVSSSFGVRQWQDMPLFDELLDRTTLWCNCPIIGVFCSGVPVRGL
jgi:hypothetical protein